MSKREDVIYGKKTGDYKNDTYIDEIILRNVPNDLDIIKYKILDKRRECA